MTLNSINRWLTPPCALNICQMLETVGVVEHGLFLDMSFAVISAGTDGITVKTK